MLNQSTINGTRIVDGAVITTVNCPVVADVRFDRAGSQPKHLGKRLHQRRLPALARLHRPAAVAARYASMAASYSAQPAAAAAESWRMRMPASPPGSRSATAPAELPASAWASLVLARAV